jgi:hypothetical protein
MISNTTRKTAVIRCPHCGAEYLPGEIYMPGDIIGQPDELVKDSLGKIIYEDYSTEDRVPNLTESFTCEYCEKPFIIEAIVTYKTKEEVPEKDFSTQYVSLLSD